MESKSSSLVDYKLNNPWVIWYHNPSDNNWDIKSYVNVFEINNLDDYCRFQNSRKHLPSLDTSMFFMMRKKSDYEYIYPMWEDDNNKKGGCWSFKISSDSLDKIWDVLSSYLVGENIGNNYDNSMKINGISFSPKKGFSIVKIWNKNSENKELIKVINNELSDYLNLEDTMYKSHLENISKDLKKKERFEKKIQQKKYYQQKNWKKKSSHWKKKRF